MFLYVGLIFSKERLLISYSINCTVGVVLIIFNIFSDQISSKQFSSPHQKLIIDPSFNFVNYPPNRTLLNQIVSVGDISLLDNLSNEYSSNREIDFITDNLGYRNVEEFSNGDVILLGDSYVVGNGGVDQSDTISSKINKYTGVGIYNLGFPGDPFNYYHRLLKHDKIIDKSDGIIFFVFEGNDLNCPVSKVSINHEGNNFEKMLFEITSYRLKIFDKSFLYKIGFGFYHRVYSIFFDDEQKTYRGLINGKKTAFLKDYVDVVYEKEICPKRIQEFSAIYDKYSEKIKMVVYIPTKAHVYFESLGNHKPINKKQKRMRDLANSYNIDFFDLTETFLKNESQEILYFTDDSHWNSFGIDLAARVISSRLKAKLLFN